MKTRPTVDAPRGRWLIAGTPLNETYPCMCYGRKPCGTRCPCNGRTDIDEMPAYCCGKRAVETAQRHSEPVKG